MADRSRAGPARPAARSMPALLVAALLAATLLAVAAGAPGQEAAREELPFGKQEIRDYVAERLSELAGRELRIVGDFSVDLGWQPIVRVERVYFANADWGEAPHLLALDALEVTLDMRALVEGRVVLPELRLIGPELWLETSADGKANWILKGEEETVVQAVVPEPVPAAEEPGALPQVHRFTVTQGRLSYRDGSAADPQWIRGKIAQATGRADAEALTLDATGSLAGDPYRLSLGTASLAALRAGKAPNPVRLSVETGASRLRAQGTVVAPFALEGLDLDIEAAGPGLDRLPLLADAAGPGRLPLPLRYRGRPGPARGAAHRARRRPPGASPWTRAGRARTSTRRSTSARWTCRRSPRCCRSASPTRTRRCRRC